MNRLPSELRSTPPSPRTDSVTSSPRTDSGQTMWVGWNWTNSMFISAAPASSARACPSPVYSNSWEYTGDGHALALLAGAALMNMEFVQFHPTHMVWPLSVRGLLVTESVRGDGGVLRNSEGKRFMFNYVP